MRHASIFHALVVAVSGGMLYVSLALSVGAAPIGLESPTAISPMLSPFAPYDRQLESLWKSGRTGNSDTTSGRTGVASLLEWTDLAMRNRDFPTAVDYLTQVDRLAKSDLDVQIAWGRYYAARGQFAKAEAALRRAIATHPQALPPRLSLGTVYLLGLRKIDAAVTAYRGAVDHFPVNAAAHYALGTALAQNGDIKDAITSFEEAARLAPDNPLPLGELGRLYANDTKFDAALDAFGRAIEIQSTYIQARVARGDVYLLQRKDDKALQEYLAVVRLAAGFPPGWTKLGMFYQHKNQPGPAEQAYLTAVKLDPKQAIAYNNLALLTAVQPGRLDEAERWAKKAVELAPMVGTYRFTLGWVHHKRGDRDKAVEALGKAAAFMPRNAEVFYALGLVFQELEKFGRAVAAFERALTLGDDFPAAADARLRHDQLRPQK